MQLYPDLGLALELTVVHYQPWWCRSTTTGSNRSRSSKGGDDNALDVDADTLFDVRIFTTLNGLTAFTRADVDTETYAIFGDLTYDIGDRLSVSLGGRYTWDERRADILRQNYLGGGSPFFGVSRNCRALFSFSLRWAYEEGRFD